MKKTAAVKNVDTKWRNDTTMLVGRIVRLDDNRQILVDYPGNTRGPLAARLTVSAKREILTGNNPAGREVLLAFIDNDPQRPLIVDAVYSLLDDITDVEGDRVSEQAARPRDALIDGKRVVFRADEEVVLECGKSRITLTRAGKVIIEGEYISSNSRGANKIKGGSIQLN